MRSNWDGYPPAECRQTESWHWLQLSACHTGRACTPRPMLWKPAEEIWSNEDLWGDGLVQLPAGEIDALYISRFCNEPGGGMKHGAVAAFPIPASVAPRPHLAQAGAELWGKLPAGDRLPLR